MDEPEFLSLLRTLPLHSGARGLADDVAVLGDRILTTDLIVEGVHFLPDDTPEDVAWKLVAVNLSDLAAKGAKPEGVLLGYPLGDNDWDRRFVAGLGEALTAFACPLLGGDTVTTPPGSPRFLSLTAIGISAAAPARKGAKAGDALWVTGSIGDAGAGLAIARGKAGPAALLQRYRRPTPRLEEGQALAPQVHAMMDVSDGLLLDAARMAEASGLAVTIDLAAVPLSAELQTFAGTDRAARIAAATAGDDYELLYAAPVDWRSPIAATRIGVFTSGGGLTLRDGADVVPLPSQLGYLHR
jgi:thiamine-monophosphate kinase